MVNDIKKTVLRFPNTAGHDSEMDIDGMAGLVIHVMDKTKHLGNMANLTMMRGIERAVKEYTYKGVATICCSFASLLICCLAHLTRSFCL